MSELSLSVINRFGGTQPRARLDEAIIQEYAEAMIAGDVFPPVTTFHDGETYWLADGFHRVNAALRAGCETIEADVRMGTQRDAVLLRIAAIRRLLDESVMLVVFQDGGGNHAAE